jgi:hypothetical protein
MAQELANALLNSTEFLKTLDAWCEQHGIRSL